MCVSRGFAYNELRAGVDDADGALVYSSRSVAHTRFIVHTRYIRHPKPRRVCVAILPHCFKPRSALAVDRVARVDRVCHARSHHTARAGICAVRRNRNTIKIALAILMTYIAGFVSSRSCCYYTQHTAYGCRADQVLSRLSGER